MTARSTCAAAAAAKGGGTALKPLLLNLYHTRMTAYRSGLQHFVEGYREGLEEDGRADLPPGLAEEMAAAAAGGGAEADSAAEERGGADPAAPRPSPPQQQQQPSGEPP